MPPFVTRNGTGRTELGRVLETIEAGRPGQDDRGGVRWGRRNAGHEYAGGPADRLAAEGVGGRLGLTRRGLAMFHTKASTFRRLRSRQRVARSFVRRSGAARPPRVAPSFKPFWTSCVQATC